MFERLVELKLRESELRSKLSSKRYNFFLNELKGPVAGLRVRSQPVEWD